MVIEINALGRSESHRFIYKVDGDTLTLAGYDKSEKVVPIDFEGGTGITVQVYERVKSTRPSVPKITHAAGPAPMGPPGPSPDRVSSNAPAPPRYIAPNPFIPPPVIMPPARDLLKEIDQLREHLMQLEKELKNRGNPKN